MASVICLDINMQEEDIFENSNGKCYVFAF